MKQIHFKCDVSDGSVVNGLGQFILYGVTFDKPVGWKVFCETDIVYYKKEKTLFWII